MSLMKAIRGFMGGDHTKTETDIRPLFRPNPEKKKDESGYYLPALSGKIFDLGCGVSCGGRCDLKGYN